MINMFGMARTSHSVLTQDNVVDTLLFAPLQAISRTPLSASATPSIPPGSRYCLWLLERKLETGWG